MLSSLVLPPRCNFHTAGRPTLRTPLRESISDYTGARPAAQFVIPAPVRLRLVSRQFNLEIDGGGGRAMSRTGKNVLRFAVAAAFAGWLGSSVYAQDGPAVTTDPDRMLVVDGQRLFVAS